MPAAILIVNPQATGVTDERVASVAEILRADVLRTERRGHATELAAHVDTAAVIAFGGDGTFNEVLNGVGRGVSVGFVPGGGSSVLPRALGLPRDPERAARRIAGALRADRTKSIAVGCVNGRRFGFSAAVGFPAEIIRQVDELGRADGRRPPDRTYALTVARALAARRGQIEPALEVDGQPAAFALVANGDPYTYLARVPLRFAPDARFGAGLDVAAPRAVRARSIPRLFAAAVFGRRAAGVLYRHDVDRIEIRSKTPLPLQVDGEDLGDVQEAIVECERGALTVLV